jgi:hypothetical protein
MRAGRLAAATALCLAALVAAAAAQEAAVAPLRPAGVIGQPALRECSRGTAPPP